MAYNLYPAVDDFYNFPPEVRAALAKSMELRNTVVPMTTTIRNNLLPVELWDGRVIANTTTDGLERYDADLTQWVPVLEQTHGDARYMKKTGGTFTGAVNSFANAAARDAAIPAPIPGQTCWLEDLKQQQTYMFSKWVPVSGVLPGIYAARSASTLFGAGVWSPVLLNVDQTAYGFGGMAPPTQTSFVHPASTVNMDLDFMFSFATVQSGIRISLGWGDASAGSPACYGPTFGSSTANGSYSFSGTFPISPSKTFVPYVFAGTAVDINSVFLRANLRGPAG